MVVLTEIEELVGIAIAVLGSIFIPLLIFFSRLWQRVGILEQEMKVSKEVRKDLQDKTLPLFHQARIDIEILKERVKEVCEDVEIIKKEHLKGKFD